jgi:hypothetical protein
MAPPGGHHHLWAWGHFVLTFVAACKCLEALSSNNMAASVRVSPLGCSDDCSRSVLSQLGDMRVRLGDSGPLGLHCQLGLRHFVLHAYQWSVTLRVSPPPYFSRS